MVCKSFFLCVAPSFLAPSQDGSLSKDLFLPARCTRVSISAQEFARSRSVSLTYLFIFLGSIGCFSNSKRLIIEAMPSESAMLVTDLSMLR